MANAYPNRSMGCAFSRSSRPDAPLPAGNLRLPLTNVRADDVVQVQFLVAWAARPETEDEDRDSRVVSPWFAVDQRHAWVLAQLEAGPV